MDARFSLIPRPASPIEYDFSKIPHPQGSRRLEHAAADSLYFYEGPLWYERHFEASRRSRAPARSSTSAPPTTAPSSGSTASTSATTRAAFTPFDCEVTTALKEGQNSAVINVDNTRIADGVPTLNTDWWNYGGLTRAVSLVTVPERFIDDYDLHLSRTDRKTIEGYVHVEHGSPGEKIHIRIADLKIDTDVVIDASGRAAVILAPQGLQLWSPEAPKLYKVVFSSGAGSETDTLTDDMGFRTIETQGSKLLLNGKPIFLRGVCIHAEAPGRTGRAYSEQDAGTLLGWAKDLGVNFVRLAHYPHDEHMTRMADKMGILVWSEIPTYWALEFDNPAVLAKAEQQLHEEQRRDRNKASVILWSVANETPNTPARTLFLSTLASKAREYDPSRLVTAALLVRGSANSKIIDDPLGKALDVIGANEYIGWYEKTAEDALTTIWQDAYDKPLIMSEFGGDARAGLHGGDHDRWTEEYQANIFRNQIVMLNKIPQLRGTTPWLLMDFRSPVRKRPGIQDDFNRKGLIAPDGTKKKAFYVMQKAYKDGTLGKPE